jgi:hypothetical protein
MTTPSPTNSERSGAGPGDPLSAEQLVREFVAFVLRVKNDFDAGLEGAGDPLSSMEAEARRLGDIVLGRNPSYGRQPWQNASRLSAQLKVLLPSETVHYGDPGEPCSCGSPIRRSRRRRSSTRARPQKAYGRGYARLSMMWLGGS